MKINLKNILLIISILAINFSFGNNNLPTPEEEKNCNLVLKDEGTAGELTVIFNKLDETCTEYGSASVNIASSPTGNYTITWWDGSHGNNLINLVPGQYSVTVSENGCTPYVHQFEIEPASLNVNINTTGTLCEGNAILYAEHDGSIISETIYAWSNGQTTQSISVTTANTYTVTVTSGTNSNCIVAASTTISTNDFFNITYNPYLCENGNSSAMVNFTNGNNPSNYYYQWLPNGEISQAITINSIGLYTVSVTSTAPGGCQGSKNFSVNPGPNINLSINHTDITCNGMHDGTATANAIDGYSANFTYQWTNNEITQTIENLVNGNYTVIVTNELGCAKTESVYIAEPEIFSYTATPDTGFCAGTTASIYVYTQGGTAPFTYYWNDVPSPIYTAGKVISPTVTTNYHVTVIDANGCTAPVQQVRVAVSQPISIIPNRTNVDCHGLCDGKVILEITGGIPPMIYSWPSLTNTWDSLCAGNYSVSITDLYGCTGSTAFTIAQPDTLIIDVSFGDATCYGYKDGFAEVYAWGGVTFPNGNYHYNWSSGQIVDSIAVGRGYYTVTVTDANGCKRINSIFVDSPEQIFLTELYGNTICIGEQFSTSIIATGGSGFTLNDYDFVWHGSDNSVWHGANLHVSPIHTTTYIVTATDLHGCPSMERSVTVTVNPPLTIDAISSESQSVCIGNYTMLNLRASGGNGGPYNYYTPTGQLINPPYRLYADHTGYYKYKVTDDCHTPAVYDSIFITVNPLPPVAIIADHLSSCPNDVYLFSEISEDFGQTYLWNFGDGGSLKSKNPQYRYNKSGIFTVSCQVTDLNGCKNSQSIEDFIEIFPSPIADFYTTPDIITIVNPFVTIENITTGATSYFWDYGDGTNSFWSEDMRQVHIYNDMDEFVITLVAKSDHDCLDTITKTIFIRNKFSFYVPTAFTPNGDGHNDLFYVSGNGISKENFLLTIVDRFGERIFEIDTYDPEHVENMAWDGTLKKGFHKKGEKAIENGIYIWRCKYVDLNGKHHEETGQVLLFR
ncbi:MAG: gliding motility-associated C-terminal domain-containing protein [Bacteroidales bacterium]|jgi:gliding motility-associated-like protein|nr:gliding motility-associated C-terminal domain-containing protein [Bacteroidales bacterium]